MLSQLYLCSGVGAGFASAGISIGGFQLIGLSEIDEYCCDILSKRFPEVLNYGDVRSLYRPISRGDICCGSIDIICASPPCQPFSVQGKRLGAADERDCFPAITEAIALIRPKFFCIENVPGLLSCPRLPGEPKSSYFRGVLRTLAECGYDAEWLCISSGHFTSPFLRERLLLVGVSRSFKCIWEWATPWTEQIRKSTSFIKCASKRGVPKSDTVRGLLQFADRMDRPIGIKCGNSINRARRAALGNALDPRVAQVALRRVLYLNSLIR
jgi:DNA (cytosine-5)-methyltransferase 1